MEYNPFLNLQIMKEQTNENNPKLNEVNSPIFIALFGTFIMVACAKAIYEIIIF